MNTPKLGAPGGFMGMAIADAVKYRAEIQKVMAGNQPGVVFNGTLEHACVVIEEAFRAAKTDIRILTNKLDCACYERDGIVDAMKGFLTKADSRLDILVEDPSSLVSSDPHDFIAEAIKLAGNRVTVSQVNPEMVTRYEYNFLVVDEKAFRFEEDRRAPVAVVGGGSESAAAIQSLLRVFTAIKSDSTPINVRELEHA